MLTVTISINGNPIYTRTAIYASDHYDNEHGNCRKYKLDDGHIIYHKPEQGAVKLAKMMLDTIKEPKLKNSERLAEWGKKVSFP